MTWQIEDLQEVAAQASLRASRYDDEREAAFVATLAATGLYTAYSNRRLTTHFRHKSYELMCLDLGEVRTAELYVPDEYGIWPGGQCYDNAHELATLHPELTYVEGYAWFVTMPVSHAWLQRDDGVIIDPTWAGLDVEPEGAPVYCGIRFDTQYLLVNTVRTQWRSVLASDWRFNSEKLRRGFVTDETGLVIDDLPEPALPEGVPA